VLGGDPSLIKAACHKEQDIVFGNVLSEGSLAEGIHIYQSVVESLTKFPLHDGSANLPLRLDGVQVQAFSLAISSDLIRQLGSWHEEVVMLLTK